MTEPSPSTEPYKESQHKIGRIDAQNIAANTPREESIENFAPNTGIAKEKWDARKEMLERARS